LSVLIDPSFSLINGLTLKLINCLYHHRQPSDRVKGMVHYEPFFYSPDAIQA